MDIQQEITRRQRYIILNSYIYYNRDYNIISDREYDEKVKELLSFKESYPEEWKSSRYYEQFYDFDGSTGFDLFDRLDDKQKRRIEMEAVIFIAQHTDKRVYLIDKKTGKTIDTITLK